MCNFLNLSPTNLGEQLAASTSKYMKQEYTLNEYTIRSELTIRNFQPNDIGTYKCVCKNGMNLGGTSDHVVGLVYIDLKAGKFVFLNFHPTPQLAN